MRKNKNSDYLFPVVAFQSIKNHIESRWQAFQEDRRFTPFERGKLDEHLQTEFLHLHQTRQALWSLPDYAPARHLIEGDLVRAMPCVSFDYNNTAPYYNASTLWIAGRFFIACEGPRSKDVPNFFRLLAAHHVTHLVRLTDAYEGDLEKCAPYWEQPLETIQSFHLSHWKDHHGIDAQELLDLILTLKKQEGLLTVHCSAGVGRTGTFLAAFAIVDAIDRKQPLSIEEIVYRLSLQRVYSVAHTAQYKTLHQLAELYV